jgi:hypothetical protein
MRSAAAITAVLIWALPALAADNQYPKRYGFGVTPTPLELSRFFATQPDGRGLPPGSGNVAEGRGIYAEKCAPCHGTRLEGRPDAGDALVGGRETLTSPAPVKTVESYWPYATTLFDYIKRAMPMDAPGSLSDSDVYAVVALVLSEAGIIREDAAMDAKTLPLVAMPNRQGFLRAPTL